MSKSSTSPTTITPEDYSHSPIHYAVAVADHTTLSRLVSNLPRLADPSQIQTETDSINQERLSDQISAVLDRRDNQQRETPLHLAVRINDAFATRTLAVAGADISLRNAAGWNALQEAVCRQCSEIIVILVQHHHTAAWSKWRRRFPSLVAVLRRMRDFYMEISFHFESSIVPFFGQIAPSDTYKIWKRDGNLRADLSLAGFDGLKIKRANQSILFLGGGDCGFYMPSGSLLGSLLVLNHDKRTFFDRFDKARSPLSDSDIARLSAKTSVYRPRMDVTKAELLARTNWRRQERVESVGKWKARVYDVNNVVFSFRSRIIAGVDGDVAGSEQILPLELEDDADEGFLVSGPPPCATKVTVVPPEIKEKEFSKSLRPSVWLTDNFPLKMEELLPLLDILANRVKAVRRMRELLTTKFPPGTFPVKISIPVVPTVSVVITFTMFQPLEQFLSSSTTNKKQQQHQQKGAMLAEPFAIGEGYKWMSKRVFLSTKQKH